MLTDLRSRESAAGNIQRFRMERLDRSIAVAVQQRGYGAVALNDGYAYRTRIQPGEAGRTLGAHLAETYRHSDESTWRGRLAGGEVRLDGRTATGAERLQAGQVLIWQRPAWDEPEVPLEFDVILADGSLLVVHKPAGLPTMPAGGFLRHTLLALVRSTYPDASPIHRLGRHTSGLVLFARSAKAAAALGRDWGTDRVYKSYRALGTGRPPWTGLEIAAPIGPVPHQGLGSVHAASPAGRPARSVARVLDPRGADTLFDVRILTGRPHQIRVHLAWAGHPLVGDPLYGAGGIPLPGTTALPGDGGYWLHAHRLRLRHPETSRTIDLEAPAPDPLA